MGETGNALIVADLSGGAVHPATLSAVTFARAWRQARGAGQLLGLVIGETVDEAAAELARYGMARVLVASHADLANPLAETHAAVIADIARRYAVDIVVGTATQTGKDILPRVAALLQAGMVSEALEIVDVRNFRRPMAAGNLVATVAVATPTIVVGARQIAWPAATQDETLSPIERVGVPTDHRAASMIRFVPTASERPDLIGARVVITAGRGVKDAAGVNRVAELADLLGAALGGTRAVCDAGLLPNELQVGQTGKVVAPDLYIGVGVSGAIQHLAGMKGARVIVAINKDPEAPIMRVADYALVARWEEALPELVHRLRAD